MELTKSDIEAIARKRYVKSIGKKVLITTMILLVFMLPCLFLPEPFGKILVVVLAIPVIAILLKYTRGEDRFTKDFVQRWESGEITFNKEGR